MRQAYPLYFCALAFFALGGCSQEPPKTDWLENAPALDAGAYKDPPVSTVGSGHSHSGTR